MSNVPDRLPSADAETLRACLAVCEQVIGWLQKLLQPADTFDYAQLIAALRSTLSMPAA